MTRTEARVVLETWRQRMLKEAELEMDRFVYLSRLDIDARIYRVRSFECQIVAEALAEILELNKPKGEST